MLQGGDVMGRLKRYMIPLKKEPQVFDGISDTPEPLSLHTPTRASHCQYIYNDDMKNPDFCKQPQTHDSYCQEHFDLCCPGQRPRARIGWQ